MGQLAHDLGVRLPGPAHLIQHVAEVVQAGPVQRQHLLVGLPADVVELGVGGLFPLAAAIFSALPSVMALVSWPLAAAQRARAARCASTSSAIRALVTVLSADVTTMASLSLARSAAARSSAALMASA